MGWYHRVAGTAVRNFRRMRGTTTLGVRGLVLDRDDRVALILHTYLDGWYLPGGGVQRGERFVWVLVCVFCVVIGLHALRIERVLGVYHDTVTLKDDHVVAYVVRTDTSAPPLRTADPFEIQAVQWFTLDGLPGDMSPATARRIAEFKKGVTGGGAW